MDSAHSRVFIAQWHRIFAENNPALILPLIDDDIEFCSPAVYSPKHGKTVVFDLLSIVFEIFEGYRVTDTWIKDNEIMFEFEARVDKYTLQGIDRFRLDDNGRVVQMKVFIRPLTGLKELARTVMKRELDKQLADKSVFGKGVYRARVRALILKSAVEEGLK